MGPRRGGGHAATAPLHLFRKMHSFAHLRGRRARTQYEGRQTGRGRHQGRSSRRGRHCRCRQCCAAALVPQVSIHEPLALDLDADSSLSGLESVNSVGICDGEPLLSSHRYPSPAHDLDARSGQRGGMCGKRVRAGWVRNFDKIHRSDLKVSTHLPLLGHAGTALHDQLKGGGGDLDSACR